MGYGYYKRHRMRRKKSEGKKEGEKERGKEGMEKERGKEGKEKGKREGR